MSENVEMRRKDSNLISFFAGTLLVSVIITIFAIIVPSKEFSLNKTHFDWNELVLTLPIFRFFFIVILALALIAMDVYFLRKYRINYMFIFGLDPTYKVTHVQLFRVAMMLLTVWMLCFMVQCFIVKLDYLYSDPWAIAGMVLIAFFVVMCLLPAHIFYLKSRKELARTLGHIIISPFGPVKFKDFFLADIITSMVIPLKDIVGMIWLFYSDQWDHLLNPA